MTYKHCECYNPDFLHAAKVNFEIIDQSGRIVSAIFSYVCADIWMIINIIALNKRKRHREYA